MRQDSKADVNSRNWEKSQKSVGVHAQTCAAETTGEGEDKGESERKVKWFAGDVKLFS